MLQAPREAEREESTAAVFFAAQIAFATAEERVSDLLDAALGDYWDEFTADYYDESIEVYGAAQPTPATIDALRDGGFAQTRFHGHERHRPCPRGACPLHYLRGQDGAP